MDNSGRKNTESAGEESAVRAEAVGAKKEKKGLYEYFTEIFFGLLYSLWGYVLGACALPFGATPFGIALLCAAEERTLFVFAGLCISAIGREHAVIKIAVYSALLLVRLLSRLLLDAPWSGEEAERMGERTFYEARGMLFTEKLALRMSSACVGALAVGVYLLVRGGFLYYDLYGALISLTVAPIAVGLFSGGFGERRKNATLRLLGFISLAAAIVYATRGEVIFGISPSAFLALFAALYTVKREGTVKGIFTGAILGLCYSPMLAPVFAFGALCGGLVFPTSVTLGTVTTFTVGSAWALYTKGIGALSGLMPALLAATVGYALADKLFLSERRETALSGVGEKNEKSEKSTVFVLGERALDKIRLGEAEERVKSACEGFSELSSVFEAMGELLKKPCEEDLRRICDNAFESSCTGCSQRSECYEKNYRRTDMEIASLTAILHKNGSVCEGDASEELRSRCPRLSDIADEINHNASAHISRLLQHDRTEIYSNDYSAVADILASAMAKAESEREYDGELSERLCRELEAIEAPIGGAAVFGGERCFVVLRTSDIGALDEKKGELLEVLFSVCGTRLSERSREELCGESAEYELIFSSARTLSVKYAMKTVRADGESEYCGDTSGVFYGRDDRLYAFISDGMGAGRDAALTSGICALFLKKLLSLGNGCEATLKLLNGFLRNKGSGSLHECSATVDLWELDLVSGRASFCKCGAAPTYVLRSGGLFKIRSKTLPIGILKEPDVKRIAFDVGEGDVVVMVSDGVTQGREECPWLFDLLRSNIGTLGIEKTAALVADYARREGSTDDLSVLILKVDGE